MSNYTIKKYQEEFLEEQEKVGTEVTKDWVGFGQTPASRLKELYSREGFDPETKLYAFKDDKLVGFLTSTILEESKDEPKTALLEFPLTLSEYNDSADLLFEKAIEILRKKGVKKIKTRVGSPYKGTVEMAKKWGYNYAEDLYILMRANVKDLKTKENAIEVEEYDHKRDKEQMVKIFVEKLGQTEEYSRTNFDNLDKNKENFPIHLIIRENNQIVGRVLAYKNPNNPKEFNFGSMYIEEESYFEPLASEAIKMMKSLGAEKTSLFLFGPTLAMENLYEAFGFTQEGKIDYYTKEI